jgi:hypothetical protein
VSRRRSRSSPAREAREQLRRVGARYGEPALDFGDDEDDLDAALVRAVELDDAQDERLRRRGTAGGNAEEQA